jgi:hypothetical protein
MGKTAGYVVVDVGGPQAWCKSSRGLRRLLFAGASKSRATLFPTYADAKTAMISENAWQQMNGWPKRNLGIVRMEFPS